MFPKGPRFELQKVSDVPGPNSYNVAADSQLENYKHGAFLEKANRFSKGQEFNVPGPGTCDPEQKNTFKPGTTLKSQNLVDRYAVLQRKVEDLERVHMDGKKAHQAEVERFKQDLAHCQKVNIEQTERNEKQKKHIDILESRIQDLKKASSSDQSEIKDLRAKLRTSVHEHSQIVANQGEIGGLKKSLQSLEARRKAEAREKDRHIEELEKSLEDEKRHKGATETRLKEIKVKDEELQITREALKNLESTLVATRGEVTRAETVILSLKEAAKTQDEGLLVQLESYRTLVASVAEEYGKLARATISIAAHSELQREHTALRIQTFRLERRLENSAAQVDELAVLIRQANNNNALLSQTVEELESVIDFYQNCSSEQTTASPDGTLVHILQDLESIKYENNASQQDFHAQDTRTSSLFSEFYRLTSERLLIEHHLTTSQHLLEQHISEEISSSLSSALASHETIAKQLENARKDKVNLEEELKTANDLVESLRTSCDSLTRKAAEADKKIADAVTLNEVALKKERDSIRRFTETVQKMRTAEDVLRSEIERLTAELVEAEGYKEAYNSLSDEISLLVARNKLAEEEAQQLSKFNAEILSHNNPGQRIMYVDRIRRELAETKHKLVVLSHEREAADALNHDLQNELNMYKSVTVSQEDKPRTAITRVARTPLVNFTQSLNVISAGGPAVAEKKPFATAEIYPSRQPTVLETISGEMTIEEITPN